MTDTMTTREVCAYLGVSDSTVWRLVRSGKLPALNWGGQGCRRSSFSRQVVEDFLARQKVWPPLQSPPIPLRTRLFRRLIIDPSGCLLWTGACNSEGYGHIGLGGQGAPQQFVHRLMYEMFAGPIPEGLELDHLCRVPRCANVAHLEPVTHAENIRRTWAHRPRPKSDERTREGWRDATARYRARKKAAPNAL